MLMSVVRARVSVAGSRDDPVTMSVIADELHITIVIVVVRHYLLYHISTCSAGVAGGMPVWMYVLVVPRMAITPS
jgi:hypothetical protein